MNAKKYIEENKKEIIELGRKLFKTPELGYKEFETKKILVDYFKKNNIEVDSEYFETGFSVSIGSQKPHIGLIAELDAIPTLGHKYANKNDNNAAHSCGHSSQCAIMAAAFVALAKEKINNGKITLFFTPAEEYTDLEYKEKLIKQKKIKYYGGKINMLTSGVFDDVDMLIHAHMKSESSTHFSVGGKLGGFIYKEITFNGKATHAAVAPDKGINALNAFVLFDNAVNMLRETFVDSDKIRVHGIVKEGGQTVNSIPEKVVYECYIRSMNEESMFETAKKIDNAAIYCSKAINAKCKIKTKPGYLPFIQNKDINEIVYKNMLKYCEDEKIKKGSESIAASDIGDVSAFIPSIEFGYGGFKGSAHSKDVEIVDEDRVYIETSKLVVDIIKDLLKNDKKCKKIKENFKPRLNFSEYKSYLNSK